MPPEIYSSAVRIVIMKFRIVFLLLLGVLAISGCSSSPQKQTAMETGDAQVSESAPAPSSEPVPTVVEGKDNSEITTVQDNYGIISETRVFRSHALLDNVVVKTIGDGTKFGYAIMKDGDKKPLTDNQIAVA